MTRQKTHPFGNLLRRLARQVDENLAGGLDEQHCVDVVFGAVAAAYPKEVEYWRKLRSDAVLTAALHAKRRGDPA